MHFQRAACSTFSGLHSKFALGPYYVSKYGIQSATAEIRRGKKERKKHYKNIMSAAATHGGHNEYNTMSNPEA